MKYGESFYGRHTALKIYVYKDSPNTRSHYENKPFQI